ncbi:heavy metal sensor histidine kinase [Bordetella bronchiseptica]|uniref:Sensor protein n=2 Tax=Bordetella bronchiseptica TaxID=518 RepID=A0A0C6PB03_BORBO|nr:heavy metal sensor histidine kinase [Bordetella bronchiseptica]SHP60887.1 Putative sensor histidine kinase PhoR [Mycobacteroides abscessus subsp. abscessus]AWP77033.1 two-component sensor histidine kinase [Bordetella bronchiseptica]AZW14606.1 two-component sensor histidine kinase [Bordetella bronchiseptica]AZW23866.1 two-component sensor histidine kinase [Bordetella bronchiseptica]KCV38748.1 heavy metal sensor kinase [Bordetella bronchiseptica 00-P-2796]
MRRWTLDSLTVRTALSFAVVSCLVVSGLGLYLYSSARQALETRADYTLVGRVERFRNMLHDLYNIRQMEQRPALFESMLGNERDVRIFRRLGEAPFIAVNPDGMAPPPMTPVPVGRDITIESLHSGERPDGVRVRWVSALAEIGEDGGTVEVTAAYVMKQESNMLSAYLLRVVVAIVLTTLLTALIGYALLVRGFRPLAAMSARATEISPANLAARLPERDAPSELRGLARQFNAMLDRLQAGYEHLSQFSADLAHEIRTPINVLMGQTQVALRQPRGADEYELLLESNLEELARLAHIVENILFLSRANHDGAAVEYAWLAQSAELAKIAEYFEGPAQERGMRFAIEASGQCRANPIMWRRAVNNLVVNAVRYGHPDSCILLRAGADANGATIVVENMGAPVSQEEADRMFGRFYRSDKSRTASTESNGLGLAIVSAIMRMHGGSASATALDDGRIRFTLRFPPGPAAPA